ncbi:MAG: hypothetical protein HUU16_08420 [Candidatus Omnitrophica bacterium]|nr:hypothetical protein [bacterium]NUN96187.1 hypothetical protein [Candidatus Omnitrophota bacterium]
MKHPSEKDLVSGALNLEGGAELGTHLAECEECAMRVKRLKAFLVQFEAHTVPELAREESSDIFSVAWRGSRQDRGYSPVSPWRYVLQGGAVFLCGLVAGYFLFAHPVQAPDAIGAEGTELVESVSNPSAALPTPEVQSSVVEAVQTPAPKGSDFWQMAGLKNVKLTPTVKYEEGKPVYGAVLEGETLGGALVMLTF